MQHVLLAYFMSAFSVGRGCRGKKSHSQKKLISEVGWQAIATLECETSFLSTLISAFSYFVGRGCKGKKSFTQKKVH